MPEIGSPAPDFTLANTAKEPTSLSSFRGKQNVVVAFFPAAFSGVCDKEMCMFRDAIADLGKLDATVLAISADAPFANREFKDRYELPFDVLSDHSRSAIAAYDVAHENFAGLEGFTAAKRSVFVVDKQGVLRHAWVAPEPKVLPDLAEIDAALSAL